MKKHHQTKKKKEKKKSFLEKVDSIHHHDDNVDADDTTNGVKPTTKPRKLEATAIGAPYFRLKETFYEDITFSSGDDIAASDDLSVLVMSSYVLDGNSTIQNDALFLPKVTVQKQHDIIKGNYEKIDLNLGDVTNGTLTASPSSDDALTQLAVSGDGKTIAVAQAFIDCGTGDETANSTVKIFTVNDIGGNDGSWILRDTLTFDYHDIGVGSKSALVVSLNGNGNYLLVGRRYVSNKKGQVDLYAINDISGEYAIEKSVPSALIAAEIGSSVMIARDRSCFIYGSVGGKSGAGSADIWCKDSNETWTRETTRNGTGIHSDFGFSVAITSVNGNMTAAVGARLHNSTDGKVEAGLVQVFMKMEYANDWKQLGSNIFGQRGKSIENHHAGDVFGFSISLGNIQNDNSLRIAIGAPNVDADTNDSEKYYHGEVSLYEINDLLDPVSDWNEIRDGINGQLFDSAGSSVILRKDGKSIAIASPDRGVNNEFVSKGIVQIYLQDEYSDVPSQVPSNYPTSAVPSSIPSNVPSTSPSMIPSQIPSNIPSDVPSALPSIAPSLAPSDLPSFHPSNSQQPSLEPSLDIPSDQPSSLPSSLPSNVPSDIPSDQPSISPSSLPSNVPSVIPSDQPSSLPSSLPSNIPLDIPSDQPSISPSSLPSNVPSVIPSDQPSSLPLSLPSNIPSDIPSDQPSISPSSLPSNVPSNMPSPFVGRQFIIKSTFSESAEDLCLTAKALITGKNNLYIRKCQLEDQDVKMRQVWIFNDRNGLQLALPSGEYCLKSIFRQLQLSSCGTQDNSVENFEFVCPTNGDIHCENGMLKQSRPSGKNFFIGFAENRIFQKLRFFRQETTVNDSLNTWSLVFSDSPSCLNERWSMIGDNINGEAAGDKLGYAVSLSSDGGTVAIGARFNDGRNGTDSGHVIVYQYDNSSWVKLGEDIDGEAEYDNFGNSVSLSSDGGTVAIGGQWNDGRNGTESGHVRVYQYDNSSWVKLGEDIDGEAEYDLSGFSVSLSSDGGTVAIGARSNDGRNGTDSGHVRVYQYENSSWVQLGEDIDGEAEYDLSGFSVSLSSDGGTVAIGALFNDGRNGTNSGHVRVYNFTDDSSWVQLGLDIDGAAENDDSGYSVSLSSDGRTVAIGAPLNDGNGTNSGHVRVYNLVPDC